MNSNLTEMLERLIIAETQPEVVTDNEFAELRHDILAALSKGHQIRFNRLSFFSPDSFDYCLDDFPF